MVDKEFFFLEQILGRSGCAKKQIAAGTYVEGTWFAEENYCQFSGNQCPRLNMPTGQGYKLCQSHHAEATLVEHLRIIGKQSNGIAWILGHYYACEPCAAALKAVGVKEIRIRETI